MTQLYTRKAFFRAGLARATEALANVLTSAEAAARRSATPRRILCDWVRPPGALAERDFLATCTRCDRCVAACPHLAVKKAGPELGRRIAGTPILVPAENACRMCENLPCVAACPTKALSGETPIGKAVVDPARCYLAAGQPCDYCERECPTAPRAIRAGEPGGPPTVDAAICHGCGLCASICPARAIRIQPRTRRA